MTEPTTQALAELRRLMGAVSHCAMSYAQNQFDKHASRRFFDAQKALLDAIEAQDSASKTLKQMGYTNAGGEYWKPPIGKAPAKVIELLDAIEAQVREIAELQERENAWRIAGKQQITQMNSLSDELETLRAELAAIRAVPVAIPADVMEAAKNMKQDGYRGPLAWARKVIDFVADYTSPVADVNAGLVEALQGLYDALPSNAKKPSDDDMSVVRRLMEAKEVALAALSTVRTQQAQKGVPESTHPAHQNDPLEAA